MSAAELKELLSNPVVMEGFSEAQKQMLEQVLKTYQAEEQTTGKNNSNTVNNTIPEVTGEGYSQNKKMVKTLGALPGVIPFIGIDDNNVSTIEIIDKDNQKGSSNIFMLMLITALYSVAFLLMSYLLYK